MELRVYAATTGDAIAGDRYGDYEGEQRRVEADFTAGVRLVVDESRGEIRGFVPADRGSQEAFVAVMSVPGEGSLSPSTYAEAVTDLFDGIGGWTVRTETPEGRLLETLRSAPAGGTEPRLPVAPVEAGEQVQAGAPDFVTAASELRAARASLHDTPGHRVYVVSLSLPVEHVAADLAVHVSGDYGGVRILDDRGGSP